MVVRAIVVVLLVAGYLAAMVFGATKPFIVTSNEPAEIDKNLSTVMEAIPNVQAGQVFMKNTVEYTGLKLDPGFGDTTRFTITFSVSSNGNFRWIGGDANRRTVRKIDGDSVVFAHDPVAGDSGWYHWIATKKTQ